MLRTLTGKPFTHAKRPSIERSLVRGPIDDDGIVTANPSHGG